MYTKATTVLSGASPSPPTVSSTPPVARTELSRCGRIAVVRTDCGKQIASKTSYIGVIVIPGVMVFPDFHTRSQKRKCKIGRFEIHVEEPNRLLDSGLPCAAAYHVLRKRWIMFSCRVDLVTLSNPVRSSEQFNVPQTHYSFLL